jgi:hypothetical protein
VRNTTYRPILRNQGQEKVSSQVGDLWAMTSAGFLQQHGSQRGTLRTTVPTVAHVTARAREDRKPISADELLTADRDLTEPPLPLEE